MNWAGKEAFFGGRESEKGRLGEKWPRPKQAAADRVSGSRAAAAASPATLAVRG